MTARARIEVPPEIAFLDGDALEALEPEWSELWRRCRASPFQHPTWLLPWARRYAPGRAGAAALRVRGRLEGLAPVFAWENRLLLAGTGPGDIGDWLLSPGFGGFSGALLAAMADMRLGPCERIELRQLPHGSTLLDAPAPAGWRDGTGEDEPCLVAPLVGDNGLSAATKSCRSNWRYAMRRIGREGGEVGLVTPNEIGPAMDDLGRLHALRWREKGESGVLADPLLDGFLRDAAPALARAGLLRLWRARLGARTIAVLFVLAGGRAQHYYIGGFHPEHARLSASSVLVGAAMAEAAREGAAEFDFLRGSEPYKARWGARPRPTRFRILTRPGT